MMRWNSTKTYTEDDMIKMQQEAVNRVHEFQARTQDVPFYDMPIIGEPYSDPSARLPLLEAESRELPTPAQPALPQTLDPIRGLLDKLDLDSETLLVLGLMFLLYNEKADSTLLLALAYLLF